MPRRPALFGAPSEAASSLFSNDNSNQPSQAQGVYDVYRNEPSLNSNEHRILVVDGLGSSHRLGREA